MRGWARQFWLMKEKRRCSILFHLLVPGGRWLTVISRPSSLASFCSSRFHSRTREPLLPPPAAVISTRGASGAPGIPRPTEVAPPLADAVDREGGGVMIDTDAHPSSIRRQIIDAVGHRTTEFFDQKVVDPDFFRMALRAILAAIVAEIADQFLLLGVDRDHWLLFGQSRGHLGVDVGELRIPVGVAVALLGLAVALQAVTRRIEQFGHQSAAHLVALHLQRLRQPSHALAGPPQRQFRIPAGRWFAQRL